jgi:hypothetical protein
MSMNEHNENESLQERAARLEVTIQQAYAEWHSGNELCAIKWCGSGRCLGLLKSDLDTAARMRGAK